MSEDIRKMIDKVKNFKQFVNEQKSYNDYDKIQFNKKSEYQDLTFRCVNFREGMSKHQIDCDLYCIEKDAMVAHGTIEWIIGRFGDELGMNIINRDEVENISNNRVEFFKSLKEKS